MAGLKITKSDLYSGRKKGLLWLIKLIVAAVILTLLVRKFSFDEIVHSIETARTWPIGAASILVVLNIYFQYKRWRRVVILESEAVSKKVTLFSLLSGITLGMITPGRIGEFGRFLFIKNAKWSRLLGFLLVDKFYGFCSLLLVGSLGLTFSLRSVVPPALGWLPFLITGLIFLILIFVVANPAALKWLFAFVEKRWSHHRHLVNFASVKNDLTPGLTVYLFGFSLFQALVYLTQLVLLVRAFAPAAIFQAYSAAASIFITKAALPVAVADLGIRESAAIFYFGRIGVPQVAAFEASLLLFAFNLLLPGLAGLVLMLWYKPFERRMRNREPL